MPDANFEGFVLVKVSNTEEQLRRGEGKKALVNIVPNCFGMLIPVQFISTGSAQYIKL